MDHVVVNVQPFLAQQEVSVYKDGNCVETTQCTMQELSKTCYALCKKFNINELDVAGVPAFSKRLKDSMASTQFEDFKINVNIF